ncbi:molybdate ABC transporter substrate-binding protein [Egicoccus sp. AB-alg2]|uniref:molybdate ABC transporter substrate-binding protein n=1 Tax=Egicoccus sp. AB-alg2 TaxID=3242693 RepID=UPI00359F04D6
MRVRLVTALTVLATLLLAVACAGTTGRPEGGAADPDAADSGRADADTETTSTPLRGELLVFAAASLTDVFEELGSLLEDAHPELTVTFNLAGSQTLAGQLVEGAPADVFASASGTQMDAVAEEGLVDEPVPFATNRLAIVVEPDNPLGIRTLDDLARDDVVLVLAGEEVPAGQYAAQALEQAGVEVSPASLEVDVRAVLGKVVLGEADAAIVYESDVVVAGDTVQGIDIPDGDNVFATYPVATVTDARNPDAAAAFVDLLRSPEGTEVLERYGFGVP